MKKETTPLLADQKKEEAEVQKKLHTISEQLENFTKQLIALQYAWSAITELEGQIPDPKDEKAYKDFSIDSFVKHTLEKAQKDTALDAMLNKYGIMNVFNEIKKEQQMLASHGAFFEDAAAKVKSKLEQMKNTLRKHLMDNKQEIASAIEQMGNSIQHATQQKATAGHKKKSYGTMHR